MSRFLARSALSRSASSIDAAAAAAWTTSSSKIPQLGQASSSPTTPNHVDHSRSAAVQKKSNRGIDRVLDQSQIKGLGADIGTCGINGPITTEDGKLNVNCANNTTSAKSPNIGRHHRRPDLLPRVRQRVRRERLPTGWHRDRRDAGRRRWSITSIRRSCIGLEPRHVRKTTSYESLKDPLLREELRTSIPSGELQVGPRRRRSVLDAVRRCVHGRMAAARSTSSRSTNVPADRSRARDLSAQQPEQDPVILDPKKLYMLAELRQRKRQAARRERSRRSATSSTFVARSERSRSIGIAEARALAPMQGSAANAALIGAGLAGLATRARSASSCLDKTKLNPDRDRQWPAPHVHRSEAYGEDRAQGQVNKDGSAGVSADPVRRSTGVWDTKVVPQNVRRPPDAKRCVGLT